MGRVDAQARPGEEHRHLASRGGGSGAGFVIAAVGGDAHFAQLLDVAEIESPAGTSLKYGDVGAVKLSPNSARIMMRAIFRARDWGVGTEIPSGAALHHLADRSEEDVVEEGMAGRDVGKQLRHLRSALEDGQQ